MLDLLSQFISNGSGSEMSSPSHDPARSMRPRDQTDGVQRFRTKSSRGHVKCWRVMYQIVDLYSSLPREAKNKGFLKRNTVGRGSAGEFSINILFA